MVMGLQIKFFIIFMLFYILIYQHKQLLYYLIGKP